MTEDRVQVAVRTLDELRTRDLSPWAMGRAREAALIKGLHGLAARYNRRIEFTRIDGNGEMDFNIADGASYGEALAAILSKIPRRTGVLPTTAAVLPENSWCRINHFDVERLLYMTAVPG